MYMYLRYKKREKERENMYYQTVILITLGLEELKLEYKVSSQILNLSFQIKFALLSHINDH